MIPRRNLNQWLCNFWGVKKVSFRQVDSREFPAFVQVLSVSAKAGSADLAEL